MKLFVSLLSGLIFLLACSADREVPSGWTQVDLVGATITLINDRAIETYTFQSDGNANASFGTRDGPVAGPILCWKLANEILVISDIPDAASIEELRLISVSGHVLTVKTKAGAVVKFEISRHW